MFFFFLFLSSGFNPSWFRGARTFDDNQMGGGKSCLFGCYILLTTHKHTHPYIHCNASLVYTYASFAQTSRWIGWWANNFPPCPCGAFTVCFKILTVFLHSKTIPCLPVLLYDARANHLLLPAWGTQVLL